MNTWIAHALPALAALGAAAATLMGLLIAGVHVTSTQVRLPYSESASAVGGSQALPADGTLKVAVVLGRSGTVATDALGPYEVFARSSAFSVYTVAADAGPVAVDGAPSILPDYTFADVDADTRLRPDVVVIPAVDDPEGATEADLRAWVVARYEQGAHVLGVCAGARILAAARLLDGRVATSHWSRLDELRRSHPEADWVEGRRFVRDGRITTTAGITSGIPGALAVIHEVAGPGEAAAVGAQVGYPGWSLDGPVDIPVRSFDLGDRPVAFNTALPWFRPVVGVALVDGVSEIDVAGIFEVYNVSAAARTVALTPAGSITTRHGITLLGLPYDNAPDVDMLVQPGATAPGPADRTIAAWTTERGATTVLAALPDGRGGFDGALELLAHEEGADTARSAAKMVDYPTDHLALGTGPSPARTWLLLTCLIGVACLVGAGTYLAVASRIA